MFKLSLLTIHCIGIINDLFIDSKFFICSLVSLLMFGKILLLILFFSYRVQSWISHFYIIRVCTLLRSMCRLTYIKKSGKAQLSRNFFINFSIIITARVGDEDFTVATSTNTMMIRFIFKKKKKKNYHYIVVGRFSVSVN